MKELNIIVKADVQGSVEAVRRRLRSSRTTRSRVKVIHGARRCDQRVRRHAGRCVRRHHRRLQRASRPHCATDSAGAAGRGYAHVPRYLRLHRGDGAGHEGHARTASSRKSMLGHAEVRTRCSSITGAGAVARLLCAGWQDPAQRCRCVWCVTASLFHEGHAEHPQALQGRRQGSCFRV